MNSYDILLFYILLSIMFSKSNYVIWQNLLIFFSFISSLKISCNAILTIFTLFSNSTQIHSPLFPIPYEVLFVLCTYFWVYIHTPDHAQLIKYPPLRKLTLHISAAIIG